MQNVRARLCDYADLRACALAVLSAVCVRNDIEFADSVDAEQLAASSSRCNGKLARAGVFNSVKQKQVVTWPAPLNRECVAIARAGVSAFHGAVIDSAGVESDQVVEAAAIQGQILDLALVDDSRDRSGCGVHYGSFGGHGHLLDQFADLELQINNGILANLEVDASPHRRFEPGLLRLDLMLADRKRRDAKVTGFIGGNDAGCSGLQILHRDRGVANRRTGGVFYLSRNRVRALVPC